MGVAPLLQGSHTADMDGIGHDALEREDKDLPVLRLSVEGVRLHRAAIDSVGNVLKPAPLRIVVD